MVSAQVALLVLLLTSAGLFTRTLQKLRAVDAGFHEDRVLVINVPTGPEYPPDKTRQLYEELYTRFSGLPGVESVSVSMDTPPTSELSMCGAIQVPGRPLEGEDALAVCRNFVGPHFFRTMRIPVLAGRDFEPGDDERAQQSIVISESVARRFFGGVDPIGRQILGGGLPGSRGAATTVVGVAKDVRYTSLRVDAPLMIYRPYRQEPGAPANTFLIRTSSPDPENLTPLLRAEIRAAGRALPPSIVSLEDRVAGVLVEERILAALSSATALLGAVLAAIGIYGAVAASVARRQREIGIRIALGARPGNVAWMTVSEAFALVATGLAIGVPAALGAAFVTRASLAGILFELSPTDPITLAGSAASILVIASLAAYAPARRAAGIDPVATIRNE
jgi:predicted permease